MYWDKRFKLDPVVETHTSIVKFSQKSLEKLDQSGQEKFIHKVVQVLYGSQYFLVWNNCYQYWYGFGPILLFICTNAMLQGSFLKLGIYWLVYTVGQTTDCEIDPLIYTFPRKTVCQYAFGEPALLQCFHCFHHSNSVNEKVFLIIWFVLVFAIFGTIWYVLERIVYRTCPRLRLWHMKQLRPTIHDEAWLKRWVTAEVHYWYILFLLSKNMKPKDFQIMLNWLADNPKLKELLIKADKTEKTSTIGDIDKQKCSLLSVGD